MKVIVAGMPKTGTKSMNSALKMLGYSSVYDFPENSFLLTDEYEKIVCKGWTTDDFRRMYENVDAVCDLPASFFWDEIHKAFPDAKIILTIRDNEDEWIRSFKNQMQKNDRSLLARFMQTLSPTGVQAMKFLDILGLMVLGIRLRYSLRLRTVINDELSKKLYRQHNAYVLHSAPKDKLLVYKCSEGWDPLCRFLGVPKPDAPFPHKNKGGRFVETAAEEFPAVRKLQREIIVSSLILSSMTILTGVSLYKYGFTRFIHDVGACANQAARKFSLSL